MTIRTKRIIYSVFILGFFVVSFYVVMKTTGYKYNIKKGILQKTGVLVVESYPRKMSVWIDGQLVKERTPTVITDLLPREYNIKIGRQGYKIWEKNIRVYPSRSSFVDYVEVFKENPDIMYGADLDRDSQEPIETDVYEKDVFKFYFKKNKSNIFLTKENIISGKKSVESNLPISSYKFFDFGIDKKYLVVKDIVNDIFYLFFMDGFWNIDDSLVFKDIKNIYFNKKYDEILMLNDYEIWIVSLKTGKKDLIVRLSKKIDDAVWSESERSIIYITDDRIYAIESHEIIDRMQYEIGYIKDIKDILYIEKGFLYLKTAGGDIVSADIQ